ncbi:5890_t:CDS:10 [Paraglomus brasilianum]|uniref:5890_t:CDS:1 n=1 Tax=Paraglomus brasilianum TaxID=144538 RepID=A0A9N8Z562_9GLOM|nr:5890_t:CDS:10 [Paraglomus brasilianum]
MSTITSQNSINSSLSNVTPPENWQQELLVKLLVRDRREKAFSDFVEAYNALAKRLAHYAERNIELEQQYNIVKEENTRLLEETKILREQGSPLNQQRTAQLEEQISNLKEERAELYKTQGTNAQRLLDMNDLLRKTEEESKKNLEEYVGVVNVEIMKIIILTEANQILNTQVNQKTQTLNTKDGIIQVLQDEVATLQLELVKTGERMKDLEKENKQLLQRWLKKKNEEAEKMNEANLFYESTMEMRQKALEIQSGVVIVEKEATSPTARSVTMPETSTGLSRHELILFLCKYIVVTRSGSKTLVTATIPTATLRKFMSHDGEILSVQTSTDGNMFATGSSDKTIRIYDARGNPRPPLSGSLQSVMHVCFNSTNEMIAGASNDNATRLWHIATGRIRHTLTGHIGKVYSARFNGDSSRVITGSHDRTIKVWDLQKGYCIRTIFSFSSCNDVVLLDDDGSTLASGHLDNNLRFWDVRSGKDIKEMTGIHLGQITSVSVSPDGSKVLTSSRDNTLKIVDLRSYEVVQTLHAEGYKNGANWSRACFSPDGQFVAAGSIDGTIYYWNTTKSKLEKTAKEHNAAICGVSWSPQGTHLFSADKERTVCIWGNSWKA